MQNHMLGRVLPYCAQVTQEEATKLVELLVSTDNICRNGSSFAISADAPPGWRVIFLSRPSWERLSFGTIVDQLQWTRYDYGNQEEEGLSQP